MCRNIEVRTLLKLSIKNTGKLRKVAHALSSEVRLKIVELLNKGNVNKNQLSDKTDIPVSTAAFHIKILEEAELILTELHPLIRGGAKK
jgi:predicted transcriptional regulator